MRIVKHSIFNDTCIFYLSKTAGKTARFNVLKWVKQR